MRGVPRTQQLCEELVRSLALDGAAVAMITDTGERDLVHATDPVIAHLDELQFTLTEGRAWMPTPPGVRCWWQATIAN